MISIKNTNKNEAVVVISWEIDIKQMAVDGIAHSCY